jgi:hypothetical protein
VSINFHNLKKGSLFIETSKEKVHSIYVLNGEIEIESKRNLKGTFLTISQTNSFEISCNKKSTIFEVISPLYPSYRTYS